MAKKNIKKQDEPVANCDQFEITNCDIKNIRIEDLIRTIRGQQVMLDSDLAMLYGVETRSLNQSVKRNIRRFPSDFMFQLTKLEWNYLKSQIAVPESADNEKDINLKSQIVISSWGGSRTNPFVFTRNGVGSSPQSRPFLDNRYRCLSPRSKRKGHGHRTMRHNEDANLSRHHTANVEMTPCTIGV